jgi:rhamnogalacturonyl hydrolase YesR
MRISFSCFTHKKRVKSHIWIDGLQEAQQTHIRPEEPKKENILLDGDRYTRLYLLFYGSDEKKFFKHSFQ